MKDRKDGSIKMASSNDLILLVVPHQACSTSTASTIPGAPAKACDLMALPFAKILQRELTVSKKMSRILINDGESDCVVDDYQCRSSKWRQQVSQYYPKISLLLDIRSIKLPSDLKFILSVNNEVTMVELPEETVTRSVELARQIVDQANQSGHHVSLKRGIINDLIDQSLQNKVVSLCIKVNDNISDMSTVASLVAETVAEAVGG